MFKLSLITLLLCTVWSLQAAKCPHGANFKLECATCHSPESWKVEEGRMTFNHAKTRFPLVGQHKQVSCRKCHTDLVFDHAKTDCNACHTDVHQQTTGRDCERCHTPNSWLVTNVKPIHQAAGFPLVGSHASADCRSCHKSASMLRFDVMSKECYSCHRDQYNAAPGHLSKGYPKNCVECHSASAKSWSATNIDHSFFPLTGGHAGVKCDECHGTPHKKVSPDCYSCHKKNYDATKNPNHILAKFSTNCATCHTIQSWKPATFNHNTATAFPLKGGHIGVDCIKCHTTTYKGTPTNCVSCHLKNYNATTNPNHATAKFPTDCQTCHNETAWKPSTFNHNTSTAFPLKGGHVGVDCIKCHTSGYKGTPTTCVSCHLKNYNATTNPNHATAKFPTDCQTCHTETAWKPSTFNHNTSTAFPLKGGHIGVDCIKCHTTGYKGTPTTCVSCHLKNYNATTNPNHTAAKFSTDCQTCHNETAWKPSTFNHNTATAFPLKGGHIGVDCIKCHTTTYKGTPTTCVSCHLKNYNATTNPAHATAKFSTDCQLCHTVTAWKPSTFNHDAQYFRIYSGKHKGQWSTCTQCHITPSNFASFSCINCHEHSNKASVDADHKGKVGYTYSATSCYGCHARI